MSKLSDERFGFMLLDADSRIQKAYSSATYEQTLDGKLKAVQSGWTYVPLNLMNLIEELSKSEIYENDGSRYDPKKGD